MITNKKLLFPGIYFICAFILLSLIIEYGYQIGLSEILRSGAAFLYGTILFLSSIISIIWTFRKGYSPKERFIASLIPIFFWWIAEVLMRMLQGHSIFEAVYLTFFLVNVMFFFSNVFFMVVVDVICRVVYNRRALEKVKIFDGFVIAVFLVFFGVFSTTPFWAGKYFGGFQNNYRSLFMGETFEPYVASLEQREMPQPIAVRKDSVAQRPNIVFILSDDHRWDYMSNMGHDFIETPAMDKLFDEGVRFNNAFVNASLCSPSRASFLTGQYPQKHGVFNNFTPWNNKNQTFFEYLKDDGYKTAFIGKWHMPGGLPELRGVDEFVTFTVVGGQGKYWNCPLVVNGKDEPSRKPYIAEELTDRSIEFIHENRDEPFVLYLSHKSVHAPFSPDHEEKGAYKSADIELPDGSHEFTTVTNGKYVHFMYNTMSNSMKNYGEAVTSLDRQIGRVIDEIDDMGLTENTIFIYTSDNGQVWGEHREIDKRMATEESIRIPWVMRYPKLIAEGGREIDEMILNVDLFPTLLDLAGLEIPSNVQGASIKPLLTEEKSDWRKDFYYSYYYEPPYTVQTVHSVRTDDFKYNEYDVKEPELFDLKKDPKEKNNLLHEKGNGQKASELKQRLERYKKEISK